MIDVPAAEAVLAVVNVVADAVNGVELVRIEAWCLFLEFFKFSLRFFATEIIFEIVFLDFFGVFGLGVFFIEEMILFLS